MMSWLSRLFGGGASSDVAPGPPKVTGSVEHRGFTIRAEPYRNEGGQYQTAGTIAATVDGAEREHRFVRADQFPTIEGATEMALSKGRQIVDEQGKGLFPVGTG